MCEKINNLSKTKSLKIMEIVIDVDNNDMNLIMSTTKEYL